MVIGMWTGSTQTTRSTTYRTTGQKAWESWPAEANFDSSDWVNSFAEHYQKYLGDQFSPRQVYARSSAKNRCLESVSCLLAGAYPPESVWKWSEGNDPEIGSLWQPIPIYTVPLDQMNDDRLLRTEAKCLRASQEMDSIERLGVKKRRLIRITKLKVCTRLKRNWYFIN